MSAIIRNLSLLLLLVLAFIACEDEVVPKPKALLHLDYPEAEYQQFSSTAIPYEFVYNARANPKLNKDQTLEITYPAQKARIFLNYRSIEDYPLDSLLRDAQKFTLEHVIKATEILDRPFINEEQQVYGMLYEVRGNAASSTQFYATDSLAHFLYGSVYFDAKPNYDSILPAIYYLRNDARILLESLVWKTDE
ncbi:MAG: gliding motility lipoprotein GldD [Flavobacteriaceae bacterium]|nr:gliding motility lipoprotein GldD [Flavobacteriaceae bacterium]